MGPDFTVLLGFPQRPYIPMVKNIRLEAQTILSSNPQFPYLSAWESCLTSLEALGFFCKSEIRVQRLDLSLPPLYVCLHLYSPAATKASVCLPGHSRNAIFHSALGPWHTCPVFFQEGSSCIHLLAPHLRSSLCTDALMGAPF